MLVQMLRFKDNIIVIAQIEEELYNILTKINYHCNEYNMNNLIWKNQNTNLQQAVGTEFEHNNWKFEVGYSSIFTNLGSKIIYHRKFNHIKSRKAQEKQSLFYMVY